jgi:5'-3' exonuclease
MGAVRSRRMARPPEIRLGSSLLVPLLLGEAARSQLSSIIGCLASSEGIHLVIYLVDGTYELFRHYYALPSARDRDGREVAAVRGVLSSVLGMIKGGATHIAVATDHVIESFRNQLWPGYKTGDGIEPELLAQFPLLEDVLAAAGVVVWPMVEFEADDAIAAAAASADKDNNVTRVIICTPDKDLAQCVSGSRIVQLNRRTRVTLDEEGVVQKFGVLPESIPDYLALVGDAADGYPGLPGWGAKSSAAVLAKFLHLESIPKDCREWRVNAASAGALADTLCREWDRALLFRRLATLRTDIALFNDVEELRWRGPTPGFDELAAGLDAARTLKRRAGEPRLKRTTMDRGPQQRR